MIRETDCVRSGPLLQRAGIIGVSVGFRRGRVGEEFHARGTEPLEDDPRRMRLAHPNESGPAR